jgi:hypothetical protein
MFVFYLLNLFYHYKSVPCAPQIARAAIQMDLVKHAKI